MDYIYEFSQWFTALFSPPGRWGLLDFTRCTSADSPSPPLPLLFLLLPLVASPPPRPSCRLIYKPNPSGPWSIRKPRSQRALARPRSQPLPLTSTLRSSKSWTSSDSSRSAQWLQVSNLNGHCRAIFLTQALLSHSPQADDEGRWSKQPARPRERTNKSPRPFRQVFAYEAGARFARRSHIFTRNLPPYNLPFLDSKSCTLPGSPYASVKLQS